MNGKRRFNIIDVLILILFAGALATVLYFFVNRGGMFTKYKYDIAYSIRIDRLDADFSNGVAEGDTIRDKYTTFSIGRVESVSVTENPVTPNGERTVCMTVNVRARAEEHDGMLSVNGVTIAKGQNIFFRTPGLECLGQCTELTMTEREGNSHVGITKNEKTLG